MDIHRCDDCDHWHISLNDAEFAALSYVVDDWGDATADAEAEGELETPADLALWRHAQRVCSAIVERAIVYVRQIEERTGNPNGLVH